MSALETPCPSCGAQASRLCVDASGRQTDAVCSTRARPGLRGLLDDAEAEREDLRGTLRALAHLVLTGKDQAARALAASFMEGE